MPANLSGPSIRSSSILRSASRRVSLLVHALGSSSPLASRTGSGVMLSRGIEQAAAAAAAAAAAGKTPAAAGKTPAAAGKTPAARGGLDPSASGRGNKEAPGRDIRNQFNRLGGPAGSGTGPAPARIAQPPSQPVRRRPVDMMPSGMSAVGQLQSLCGKSDSFKHETTDPHIDLTDSSTDAKTTNSVWFLEDDISDDENLDLDFKAPTALPAQPASMPTTQAEAPLHPSTSRSVAQDQAPPPPSTSRSDAPFQWSSSPVSHLHPPRPQVKPPDDIDATTSDSKRKAPDQTQSPGNSSTKAKKRVLPASFRNQDSSQGFDATLLPAQAQTPPSKPRSLWDKTASAIQEQKKQLKNQNVRRPPLVEVTPTEFQGAGAPPAANPVTATKPLNAAKPVAISLSAEQEKVKDLVVKQGKSVFFTGPAGTGKSVLMKAIISDLKKKHARQPERFAVTASTGLAACNIGGITLHSFAGIGLGKEDAPTLIKKIRTNQKARERWYKTQCLIIDEISMVDGDLFDKLSHIGRVLRRDGRPWGGIQLVITGDFFQLPPVPDFDKKTEGATFAFDAATWSTSIDHTIGLTQVFRQRDPHFAGMLNEMRLGRLTQSTVEAFQALSRPLEFDDGVESAELYPTRVQVEESNQRRLKALSDKPRRYDAADTGDPAVKDKLLSNMMAPKSLELRIGAQVMLIKNMDDTLVNGSLGKVIDFADEDTYHLGEPDYGSDDDMAKAKRKLASFSHKGSEPSGNGRKFPLVQFVSTSGAPRVILCQPEEWKVELPDGKVVAKRTQLPLILAWALSIHKAQGQTLERVTVDLRRVFEKGQAYVALSRATSQEGLRVLGFEKSKVMAHPRVISFYDKLYSVEQLAPKAGAAALAANGNGKRAAQWTSGPGKGGRPAVVDLCDDEEEEAMASYGY